MDSKELLKSYGLTADRKKTVDLINSKADDDQFVQNDLRQIINVLSNMSAAEVKSTTGLSKNDVANYQKFRVRVAGEIQKTKPKQLGPLGSLYPSIPSAASARAQAKATGMQLQTDLVNEQRGNPALRYASGIIPGISADVAASRLKQQGIDPGYAYLAAGSETDPYRQMGAETGYTLQQTLGPTAASVPTMGLGGAVADVATGIATRMLPPQGKFAAGAINLLRGGLHLGGAMAGGHYGSQAMTGLQNTLTSGNLTDKEREVGQSLLGPTTPGGAIGGLASTLAFFKPTLKVAGAGVSPTLKALAGDYTGTMSNPMFAATVKDVSTRGFFVMHSAMGAQESNKRIEDSFLETNKRRASPEELQNIPGYKSNANILADMALAATLGGTTKFGEKLGAGFHVQPDREYDPNAMAREVDALRRSRTNTPELRPVEPATPFEIDESGNKVLRARALPRFNFAEGTSQVIAEDQAANKAGISPLYEEMFEPVDEFNKAFGESAKENVPFVPLSDGSSAKLVGMSRSNDYFVMRKDASGRIVIDSYGYNGLPKEFQASVDDFFNRNNFADPTSPGGQRFRFDPKLAYDDVPDRAEHTYNPENDMRGLTEKELADKKVYTVTVDGREIKVRATGGRVNAPDVVEVETFSGIKLRVPKKAVVDFEGKTVSTVEKSTWNRQPFRQSRPRSTGELGNAVEKDGIDFVLSPKSRARIIEGDPDAWASDYDFEKLASLYGMSTAELEAELKTASDTYTRGKVVTLTGSTGKRLVVLGGIDKVIDGKRIVGLRVYNIGERRYAPYVVPYSEVMEVDRVPGAGSEPGATPEPELNPAAVETPELDPTAVETPELNPAAVETPELNPAAVETPELNPAAVETPVVDPAALDPAVVNEVDANTGFLKDNILRTLAETGELKYSNLVRGGAVGEFFDWVPRTLTQIKEAIRTGKIARSESVKLSDAMSELIAEKKVAIKPGTADTFIKGENFDYVVPKKSLMSNEVKSVPDTEFNFGDEFKVAERDENLPNAYRGRGDKNAWYRQTAGDELRNTAELSAEDIKTIKDSYNNGGDKAGAKETTIVHAIGDPGSTTPKKVNGIELKFEDKAYSSDSKEELIKNLVVEWGQTKEQAEALGDFVDHWATAWAVNVAKLEGVNITKRLRALRTPEEQLGIEELANLSNFEQWKRGIKETVLFNNIEANKQLIVDLKDLFYKKHVPAVAVLSELIPTMADDGQLQGMQGYAINHHNSNVTDKVIQSVVFSRVSTDPVQQNKRYYTQVHEFVHALHRSLPEGIYHNLASRYIDVLSMDHMFGNIGEITAQDLSNAKNAIVHGKRPYIPMWVEERITQTLTAAIADSIIKIGEADRGLFKFSDTGSAYSINDYDPYISDIAIRISNAMGDSRVGTNPGRWAIGFRQRLNEKFFDNLSQSHIGNDQFTVGITLLLEDGSVASGTGAREYVRLTHIKRDSSGNVKSVTFIPVEDETMTKAAHLDTSKRLSPDGTAIHIAVDNMKSYNIMGVGGPDRGMPKEVIKFYQQWFGHHTKYINSQIAGMQPMFPVERVPSYSTKYFGEKMQRAVGYRWYQNAAVTAANYGKRVHELWTGAMSESRLAKRMSESFLGWLDRGGYTSFIQETAFANNEVQNVTPDGNRGVTMHPSKPASKVLTSDFDAALKADAEWSAGRLLRIAEYVVSKEGQSLPSDVTEPDQPTVIENNSASTPEPEAPKDPDESLDFFADREQSIPGIDYPEELDEYKPPIHEIPLEMSLIKKGERENASVNKFFGLMPNRLFVGGDSLWSDRPNQIKFGVISLLDGFTKLSSRLVYPLVAELNIGKSQGGLADSDFGYYVKPGATASDIDAAVVEWQRISQKEQYADDTYAQQWNALTDIEKQQVVELVKAQLTDVAKLRQAQDDRLSAIMYDDGLSTLERVNNWAIEEFWRRLGPDYVNLSVISDEFKEMFKGNSTIAKSIDEQIELAKPRRDDYQKVYEERLAQQKLWEATRAEREAAESKQFEEDKRHEAEAFETFIENDKTPSEAQRQAWQSHQEAVSTTLRNVIRKYMRNPVSAVADIYLGEGILANSAYGAYINRYVLGAYRMRLPKEDQQGFVFPSVTKGTARGVMREAGTDRDFRVQLHKMDAAISKAEKLWWETNGEYYRLAEESGDRSYYKLYETIKVDDGQGNVAEIKGKTQLEEWMKKRRNVLATMREHNRKEKLGVRAQRGRDLDPRSIFVQTVQEDVGSAIKNILVNTKELTIQNADGTQSLRYVVRTLLSGEVIDSKPMSMREYQSYLFRHMRNSAKTSTARFFEDDSMTGTFASDWMSRFKRIKTIDLDSDIVTYQDETSEHIRRFSIYNLARNMARRSGALTENNLAMDKMIKAALDKSNAAGNNKYVNISDGIFKPIEFNGKEYASRQAFLDAIDAVRLGYQYDVSLTDVVKNALLAKGKGEQDEYGLSSMPENDLLKLHVLSSAVDNGDANALNAFRQFINDTSSTRLVPGLLLRPSGLATTTAYAPYIRVTGNKQRLMMFGITSADVESEIETNTLRYKNELRKQDITNTAAMIIAGSDGETIDIDTADQLDIANQISEDADITDRYHSSTYRMFKSALRYINQNALGITKILINNQRSRPLFVNPESTDGIQISFDEMDIRLNELRQNKASMLVTAETFKSDGKNEEYQKLLDGIKNTDALISEYESKIEKFHSLAKKSSESGVGFVQEIAKAFGLDTVATNSVVGGKNAAIIIDGLKASASPVDAEEFMRSSKLTKETSYIYDYNTLKTVVDKWKEYSSQDINDPSIKESWKKFVDSLDFYGQFGTEINSVISDLSKVKDAMKQINNYIAAFEYVRNTYLGIEQQMEASGDAAVTKLYIDVTSSNVSPNTALYFEMKRIHMLMNGFGEMPNIDRAFRLKSMSGTESRTAAQKAAMQIQNTSESNAYGQIYDALRWERGNSNYTDVSNGIESVIKRVDLINQIFKSKTLQSKSFVVQDAIEHGKFVSFTATDMFGEDLVGKKIIVPKSWFASTSKTVTIKGVDASLIPNHLSEMEKRAFVINEWFMNDADGIEPIGQAFADIFPDTFKVEARKPGVTPKPKSIKTREAKAYSRAFIEYATDIHNSLMFRYPNKSNFIKYGDGFNVSISNVEKPSLDVIRKVATSYRDGFDEPLSLEMYTDKGKFNAASYRKLIRNLTLNKEFSVQGEYLSDEELQIIAKVMAGGDNAKTLDIIKIYQTLQGGRKAAVIDPLKEHLSQRNKIFDKMNIQELNIELSELGWSRERKAALFSDYWLLTRAKNDTNPIRDYMLATGFFPNESDLYAISNQTGVPFNELKQQYNDLSDAILKNGYDTVINRQVVSQAVIRSKEKFLAENAVWGIVKAIDTADLSPDQQTVKRKLLTQQDIFGGDVTSLINQIKIAYRGKFNSSRDVSLINRILGEPEKLNAKSIVELFDDVHRVGARRLPGTQPRSQRTNAEEMPERQILSHVISTASKTLQKISEEMGDQADVISRGLHVLGIGKNITNITIDTLINNPNVFNVNEKMTPEQIKQTQNIEKSVKDFLVAHAKAIISARAELYRSVIDVDMLSFDYQQDSYSKNVYKAINLNNEHVFTVDLARGIVTDAKTGNKKFIPGMQVDVASKDVTDFAGLNNTELLKTIATMTESEFRLAKLMYDLLPPEVKLTNEFDTKARLISSVLTSNIEKPVPAEYWHAIASIKEGFLNPNTRRPMTDANGESIVNPLLDLTVKDEELTNAYTGSISEEERIAFVEPVLNKWMMPSETGIRRVSLTDDGNVAHDGIGYTVFQENGARSRTYDRLVQSGLSTSKALEIYALTQHPNFAKWSNGPLLENIQLHRPGGDISNVSNLSVKQKVNFNKAKSAINLKVAAQNYELTKSPEDYEKLVFEFDQVFGLTLSDKQLQAAVKKATNNGKDVSALMATTEQYMLQNTDEKLTMHVRQYDEISNSANRLETGKSFTSLAFENVSDNATADTYPGFKSHDLVSGLHKNTNIATRPRFIKMNNPYVVDMHNSGVDADTFRIAFKEANGKKYDGVVFKNVSDDMYSTTTKVIAYTLNDSQVLPLNEMHTGKPLEAISANLSDVLDEIPDGVIPAPMFGIAPALRATPIIPVEKTLGQKASEKLLRAEREWQGWTRWSLAFDMAWGAIQGGKYAIGFAAFKPMDTVMWAQSWYGALKGMAPNFRYMISGKKVGGDNIGRREYAKIYLDMRQDKHWETIKALGAPLHMYNYETAIQKARNAKYQELKGKTKYEDILIDLMDISETGHAEEYMVKDASINKIPMAGMYERQISLQHDLLMYKLIKYQLETNSLLQGLTHEQILKRPDAQKIVNFIAISLGDFQYSTDEHVDMKWGRLAKWVSVAPRWQLANWLMKPHYNWLAQNMPPITIKGKQYSPKTLLGEDNRVFNSMVRYEDNKELAHYQFKTIYGTMLATVAVQQIVNLLGKYVFKRDDIRALPKVGSWRFMDFEFHDSSGVWDDVNKTLAIYNAVVKKEKPDDKRLGAVDPTQAWFIDTSNKLGYNTSPAVLKLLNIFTGRDVLNRNVYESDENWNRYYQQNIRPYIGNAPESLDVSILIASSFPTALNELFAASNEAFYEKPAIRRAVEVTQFLFSHQGTRSRYNKYIPQEFVKQDKIQQQYKRNWSPKAGLLDVMTKPGKTIPEKGQKIMTGVYNTSSKYPMQKLVNEYKKAKLP